MVKSLQGTRAVVVSGLAQGIDSYCHEAALEYGIPTIAVIAQGLDVAIPGERRDLAKRIVESGGAILSEFENDFPAYKGNFPARNRIISGLSQSTVLVQSKSKGGALITADYCLQEGKLLLAVPGDFDSEVANGPNLYLDQGKAKPVFIPENLYCAAGLPKENGSAGIGVASLNEIAASGCTLSPEAHALFKQFNGFKKTFSELQSECNFNTGNILTILTELELSGLVETQDNFQFYFNGRA
jgi:DNA processing protein